MLDDLEAQDLDEPEVDGEAVEQLPPPLPAEMLEAVNALPEGFTFSAPAETPDSERGADLRMIEALPSD